MIEPCISIFINEISRKETDEEMNEYCLKELKQIARLQKFMNENEQVVILKKLFMQLIGYKIPEIDFIKTIAEKDETIKTIALLGYQNMEKQEKQILLIAQTKKDMSNNICFVKYLNLLGNFRKISPEYSDLIEELHNSNNNLIECCIQMNYKKYSIVYAKYCDKNIRIDNKNMIVSLQLFRKHKNVLNCDALNSLIGQLFTETDPFATYQIIRVLLKITKPDVLFILKDDTKLLHFLSQKIIKKKEKARKQIDIAISVDVCELLIKIDCFNVEAEAFITRLIQSDNINSRLLGINWAIRNGILINAAAKHALLHLKEDDFYTTALCKLINSDNCIEIYQCGSENRLPVTVIETIFKSTSDKQFRSKILFDRPEIYSAIYKYIRKDHLNIDNIIDSKNRMHFPLIYHNGGVLENDQICDIIEKHLRILMKRELGSNELYILQQLHSFAASYGDIEENRRILLQYRHIKEMQPGIVLFNQVLPDKILFVADALIPYRLIKNTLEIDGCEVYVNNKKIEGEDGCYDVSGDHGSILVKYNHIIKIIN